jgi:hypothetical protein
VNAIEGFSIGRNIAVEEGIPLLNTID